MDGSDKVEAERFRYQPSMLGFVGACMSSSVHLSLVGYIKRLRGNAMARHGPRSQREVPGTRSRAIKEPHPPGQVNHLFVNTIAHVPCSYHESQV